MKKVTAPMRNGRENARQMISTYAFNLANDIDRLEAHSSCLSILFAGMKLTPHVVKSLYAPMSITENKRQFEIHQTTQQMHDTIEK